MHSRSHALTHSRSHALTHFDNYNSIHIFIYYMYLYIYPAGYGHKFYQKMRVQNNSGSKIATAIFFSFPQSQKIRFIFQISLLSILIYLLSSIALSSFTQSTMQFSAEEISGGKKYRLMQEGRAISFSSAMSKISDPTSGLSDMLIHILRSGQPPAYFFECPPVSRDTYDKVPFEFVIIPAPSLEGIVTDAGAFRDHFERNAGRSVAIFPSLGRDAMLLSPCPRDSNLAWYAHLASFVRSASEKDVKELFAETATSLTEVLKREDTKKVWLSTSGLGVSYLHIRLDSTRYLRIIIGRNMQMLSLIKNSLKFLLKLIKK